MKNIKWHIVIVTLFVTSYSVAQATKSSATPLLFGINTVSGLPFPASAFSLANTASNNNNTPLPKEVNNQVGYTAFFCKLEVKNLQRYNVWIKFHAGEYDEYSKEYNK